jgi:hypothetical protein
MSTRHYLSEHSDITDPVACGGRGYNFGSVTDRARVTCKRCLASVAKRDRAFQRKARKGIALPPYHFPRGVWPGPRLPPLAVHHAIRLREDSARAIAREEGRAL